MSPHGDPPGLARNPGLRWAVLALSCWTGFSNFYAYDLPASLSKPMQSQLGMTDGGFAYAAGLMYGVYALPNVVLPFFGGYLIDTWGVRRLLVALSAVQLLGQVVFSVGNSGGSVAAMLLGRLLFGIGGESLMVAQNTVTAKYFRGRELALALGLNLAIARMGSVANDLLSPVIAVRVSEPAAVWVGTATCMVAFCCATALGWLDHRLSSGGEGEGSSTPGAHGAERGTYFHLEDGDLSDAEGDGTQPVPSPQAGRLSRSSSIKVGPGDMSPTSHEPDLSDEGAPKHRLRSPSSPRLSNVLIPVSRASFSTVRLTAPPSPNLRGPTSPLALPPLPALPSFSDFPSAFHVLMLVNALLYATVIPFQTIHSALLQRKWYPGDPETAGEAMGLPDTISAVMAPFVGSLTDRFGRRTHTLTACGLVMASAHLLIGLARPPGFVASPVPALVVLGFGFGLLGVLWSAIPLLVPEDTGLQGSAFGFATAVFNLSTLVFPVLVAALVNADPGFLLPEMFFACCCVSGALLARVVAGLDATGKIDLPEAVAEPVGAAGGGPCAEGDEIPLREAA
ncbi:major facilitator superfamily domain-containing protein [Hyaloraphidium curvatum]|nr:major facilitator superfamily domain-containing protein [Hyaloraphidium curvatum]